MLGAPIRGLVDWGAVPGWGRSGNEPSWMLTFPSSRGRLELFSSQPHPCSNPSLPSCRPIRPSPGPVRRALVLGRAGSPT
eukprot:1107379-Pyramimonas_sp.AAC.1